MIAPLKTDIFIAWKCWGGGYPLFAELSDGRDCRHVALFVRTMMMEMLP